MENLLDHRVQNKAIGEAMVKSINGVFPITSGNRRLEITNIKLKGSLDDWDFPKQRKIKLGKRS